MGMFDHVNYPAIECPLCRAKGVTSKVDGWQTRDTGCNLETVDYRDALGIGLEEFYSSCDATINHWIQVILKDRWVHYANDEIFKPVFIDGEPEDKPHKQVDIREQYFKGTGGGGFDDLNKLVKDITAKATEARQSKYTIVELTDEERKGAPPDDIVDRYFEGTKRLHILMEAGEDDGEESKAIREHLDNLHSKMDEDLCNDAKNELTTWIINRLETKVKTLNDRDQRWRHWVLMAREVLAGADDEEAALAVVSGVLDAMGVGERSTTVQQAPEGTGTRKIIIVDTGDLVGKEAQALIDDVRTEFKKDPTKELPEINCVITLDDIDTPPQGMSVEAVMFDKMGAKVQPATKTVLPTGPAIISEDGRTATHELMEVTVDTEDLAEAEMVLERAAVRYRHRQRRTQSHIEIDQGLTDEDRAYINNSLGIPGVTPHRKAVINPYLYGMQELHDLFNEDKGEGDEAEAIRERLDDLYQEMSSPEYREAKRLFLVWLINQLKAENKVLKDREQRWHQAVLDAGTFFDEPTDEWKLPLDRMWDILQAMGLDDAEPGAWKWDGVELGDEPHKATTTPPPSTPSLKLYRIDDDGEVFWFAALEPSEALKIFSEMSGGGPALKNAINSIRIEPRNKAKNIQHHCDKTGATMSMWDAFKRMSKPGLISGTVFI